MKPTSITWDVGKDRHGRPVRLIYEAGVFKIISDPVNQRDEGERCHDLTKEVLVAIGKIAEEQKP